MSPRQRRLYSCAFALVIVWPASILISAWKEPPFRAGTEAAAMTAAWPVDDIWFRNGTYTTLPFVFLTRVEIGIKTDRGEESAEIKLFHVPLLGIRAVTEFRMWRVDGVAV